MEIQSHNPGLFFSNMSLSKQFFKSTTKMKHNQILFSLFLLVILASCSQNSSTSLNNSGGNGGGGSTVTWKNPTVGTNFIFETKESFGNVFDTTSIASTGQHLGGKTDVIYYVDHSGGAGTAFYNIETNGDISYGSYNLNSNGDTIYTWETFPTASLLPISDPVEDTIEAGIHIFRSNVRTFVGADSTITSAGTFATLHVRATSISIINGPDSLSCNASDTDVFDTWFAPSIGLQVKVIDSGTNDGQASTPTEVDLIKYEPK
jgi:hypothetical protein